MIKWLITIPLIAALAGLVGWRIGTKGAQGAEGAAWGRGAMAAGMSKGGSTASNPASGGGRGGAGGGGGAGGASRSGTAKVEIAQRRTISDALVSVGTVESPFTVQISPKVSGRIEFLSAREGDLVTPGQLLARIDATELRSQVMQQEANLAQARSRLSEAQLRQGPTAVGVLGQVRQEQAALESVRAEQVQVARTSEAQVAAAQARIVQADAAIRTAEALQRNAEAELKRDQATLATVRSRLTRTEQLFEKGYVSQQGVEEVRNVLAVAESSVNVATGRVESARSAVESARAAKTSALQDLEIAKRRGDADRAAANARLVQAKAELENAVANQAQNPAFAQNVAALRSSVSVAEAQLGQARSRLNDTSLTSPIHGVVTGRARNQGEIASVGQALLTVQFLDWVYVNGSVSIDQISQVKKGQRAEVALTAYPGRIFNGTLEQVNPAANPESRQFQFRVRLDNPGRELKPGMFGNVRLLTRSIPNAVVVPKEAVRTTDSGSTVTVVDKDGNADIRQVTLGVSDQAGVQILKGVSPGEKVVTLSFSPPRQGQPVRTGERPAQGGSSGSGATSSGEGAKGRPRIGTP